jgi:hypothetical protein
MSIIQALGHWENYMLNCNIIPITSPGTEENHNKSVSQSFSHCLTSTQIPSSQRECLLFKLKNVTDTHNSTIAHKVCAWAKWILNRAVTSITYILSLYFKQVISTAVSLKIAFVRQTRIRVRELKFFCLPLAKSKLHLQPVVNKAAQCVRSADNTVHGNEINHT